MSDIRKLMEALNKIDEEPRNDKSKKEATDKFWMYGDVSQYGDSDVVSVSFPKKYILEFLDADRDKKEDMIEALKKKTSHTVGLVFSTLKYPEDAELVRKALKRNGTAAVGEAEIVAGFGPTKAAAKKAWLTLQDTESEEEYDF